MKADKACFHITSLSCAQTWGNISELCSLSVPKIQSQHEANMSVRKILFIVNQYAGKGKIRNNISNILDFFCRSGLEPTVYYTQYEGDGTRAVIEREPGYEMIVCSGGDGTLDEVVNGMSRSEEKTVIGYIPAGSTNDFAISLGISAQMKCSAETAVNGKDFPCDVGNMNGERFVYVAAFGMFTEVSYETMQDMKNLLGHVAYILEGMKKISDIRAYHMRVEYNNNVIEDNFILGMVTNSISVGGFKGLTGKYVELDDGVFEVTMIKEPTNMIELSSIMTALLNRDIDSNFIYCFKTSHLVIESEQDIAWTRDGEYGGTHHKVDIVNENKAIVIRVPKDK